MKKILNRVLKYFFLGSGVAIIGLLLIPTGILMMLVSVVLRTTDGLLRFLEERRSAQ